jgi:hypothetical protein
MTFIGIGVVYVSHHAIMIMRQVTRRHVTKLFKAFPHFLHFTFFSFIQPPTASININNNNNNDNTDNNNDNDVE